MISVNKDNKKTISTLSICKPMSNSNSINVSAPIPIPIQTSNHSSQNREYELQKHFFDPSKHSPPNEFMLKLYLRKTIY